MDDLVSEEVIDSGSTASTDSGEVIQEGDTSIDEHVGGSASPSEPPAPSTYKVKIDGQEVDVDLDTLLSGYQQAAASQARFQDAVKLQKQFDNIMSSAKSNPAELFQFLGIDPKGWSEEYLLKQLEEELLTPEQKADRAAKQELEEYRRQAQEAKAKKEQEAQEAAYNRVVEEIDNDIAEAVKASGLKPSPRVIARIAEQMLANLEANGEVPKASDILKDVTNTTRKELSEFLEALPTEQLLSQLPKSVIDGLRKEFVRQTKANVPAKPTKVSKGESEAKTKRKSLDELLG